MTEDKECEGCKLNDGNDHDDCLSCSGYIGGVEDKIGNPFDRVDFEVFGATQEEMAHLKQRFRDIINKVRDDGNLPTNPMLLQLFMVNVLRKVLNDHYNTY